MPTRTPVERGTVRARVAPVASPVDTYVHDNAGYGLSQLADALRTVAPEVSKYSDVKAQQQSETQKAAGEQKARELFDQGKTFRDAIKNGDIAPHESPWFQLGAKEQFGRITAGKLSSDLQDAVQKDPTLQTSTEVSDYDKFATDFKKQWVEKNIGTDNRDLNFEHGFGSLFDQLSKDSRSHFVTSAGERLVQQTGDRQYQEVFQTVDHELSMHTNPSAIADAINLTNDRAIAMGMNPRTANIATVKALGDIVTRDGDVSLFEMLKKVKTGSGNLYSTQWAQEEIQKTTEKVYIDTQRKHVADEQQQTEARETATRTMTGDLVNKMLSSDNPSRLDLRGDFQALAKINPTAAESMIRFQAAASTAHFASDETSVTASQADIFGVKDKTSTEYVTTDTLVGQLNAGEINRDDFVSLNAQVQRRDQEEERAKKDANKKKNAFNDPLYRRGLSTLAGLIGEGKTDWSSEIKERIKSAQAEYNNYYLDWLDSPAGQNATPSDRNKFITDLIDQTATSWRTADAQSSANDVGKKSDLRTPAQKAWARSLVVRIHSEIDAGQLSQSTKEYLRANNVTHEQLPQWLEAQDKYLTGSPYDLDSFLSGKPKPSLPKPKAPLKPVKAASDAATTKH